MQIWIHDNKMKKIVALNNDIPDMMSYTNSSWHSYLDQATSTFDFTIPKFSNGELHEDLKLINDECFVSFYVNGSYQVFYIATLQEDDFNIQLTCNNTNLEYALEYANPFNSSSAQSIQWYLEHMDLLSFAAVEIGNNEISDRKRTLTFDSQETKMNRLQSLMSNFDAEFEFKVELNRDGTYKRIVINIYQEADDTHHGIGTDRKDVVLYYSNGLKGVQVTSDKTQMFNAGVFDGKDGVNLANVEFSEKNADGVEEFYSRKGDIFVYAPLSMQRYPATMKPDGQDNWIRKDFQTEYENVNDLKAYALRTLKQYAYPLITYTASVQSGFVSHYTDLKLGDTIRIIDKNFVGGLALEARVSEMIISFDNPANNSFVFTNYRKLDNKPSSALQTRIEQAVESKLPYRIELATTGGVTFKNNEGETIVKPSLYKGNLPWTKDVTWHWTLNSIVTDGMQYRIQARDITDTAVLTVDAFVGGNKVATTEITLTNVNDGPQGPQGPQGDEGPKGDKGDTGNGIANTVITYGLSVSDTTEPATWSSSVPTLVKGMYLWTRTVIIYTNGESTTSYQISYIAKDADATAAIDKTKQELLEKLDTVRNDSLAAVEEAKQELSTVADDLSKAKTDFQNAVSEVDTKATNLQSDVSNLNTSLSNTAKVLQTQGTTLANQAKELQTQASQLTEQAKAQETLTTRVENVETTANGTKTTVSELNKTVAQNGKDITSISNRTKTVETSLTSAKTSISELQTSVSTAKTDLTNLTKRTKTVEDGLTGTKTNLSELTQTVSNDGKTIASLTSRTKTVEDSVSGLKTTMSSVQKDLTAVTTRTKTVEDDLSGTKTTLSQVQTTANSASQKTAALETGLNGLSARFSSLKIGGRNLLTKTNQGKTNWSWAISSGGTTAENYDVDGVNAVKLTRTKDSPSSWDYIQYQGLLRNLIEPDTKYTLSFDVKPSVDVTFTVELKRGDGGSKLTNSVTMNKATPNKWTKLSCVLTSKATLPDDLSQVVYLSGMPTANGNTVMFKNIKLEKGNIATDYSPNEADLEQKVAEYKQNTDQNYASLQSTVQNLDGTVQANKTTAEQTAAGFKTRIESLETYKSGESTRANQYFESAKTETARQLTAERTAIAKDYVAKSTYTSDVTGLRNDLTATTTTANTIKTNLANYQASNDKAVANLQSNLQTANGNISSLKTKVEAVPGQITSAVSAVEGKIPKSVGAVNLFKGSRDFSGTNWINNSGVYAEDYQGVKIVKTQAMWGGRSQYFEAKTGEEYVFSAYVKSSAKTDRVTFYLVHSSKQPQAGGVVSFDSADGRDAVSFDLTDEYQRIAVKIKITKDGWIMPRLERYNNDAYLFFGGYKLERGNIATDWSPAPEDTASQISSLSSQIKQTADGMTLLATKTELNTAKNELQSGITTATNKANSNAQIISTHTTQISALNTGLSAKVSQTDFNTLSGRVTTAENNITAKANELSSKITSVEGKIPTSSGGRNLAQGTSKDWSNPFTGFSGIQNTCPNLYKVITNGLVVGDTFKTRIVLKYTNIRPASGKTAEICLQGAGNVTAWNSGAYPSGGGGRRSLSGSGEIVFELTDKIIADHLKNDYWNLSFRTDWIASGSLQWKLAKAERGMFFTDWSPAPEDAISQISSLSSEFKQTTDAIKASVSSLDKSTVKSASLTINADGIVMKAGKSTTDVANAIGSYFAVNQNAINLFADKIKVKGSMIVDGAITSNKISAGAITGDKIAANSINSSKIVSSGITANVIKGGVLQSLNGSTNFELDTGKLFYNNNNTGVFRVQNGASTMGLKFSNTSISVAGTSRILSRAILGGDRRETTLDDGKWDKGGFSGIVIETIKGVDSNQNEKADAVCVVGDIISFTHTYSDDSLSARGWRMETYSPTSSYPSNVVLKPYGINYRNSNIVVGDLRLDNGDGSGYWMRATINVLKACFGHILNGGTSSQALNAIRSELNKISGT
nr:MAG TPA: tail protein [Caudoviricetes sp.]